MNDTTIAVDLAKSVFEVAVSDRPGHVSERRRLRRSQFLKFFIDRRPATILLEACGSSHYWGRQLQSLGHTVRLLPVHAVRPYVARNKTDRTDAKALLEAARNHESVSCKRPPQRFLAPPPRVGRAATNTWGPPRLSAPVVLAR